MDMFTVGEMIGGIRRHVEENARRIDRQDKRLDLWARNFRRFILVLALWTCVLIGISSTQDAAEFVAVVLRKLLMPS